MTILRLFASSLIADLTKRVQAGLKLLQDRRVEKALKAVAMVGNELKRLDEAYEELARKV